MSAAGAFRRASALFLTRQQKDLLPSVVLASLMEKVAGRECFSPGRFESCRIHCITALVAVVLLCGERASVKLTR